jgi:hypothetical protein
MFLKWVKSFLEHILDFMNAYSIPVHVFVKLYTKLITENCHTEPA